MDAHSSEVQAQLRDGGPLSDVPVIADVKAGPHRVHIEGEGYFAVDADATAVEGRLVVAEHNLNETPAELSVTAPAGVILNSEAAPAPFSCPVVVPQKFPSAA